MDKDFDIRNYDLFIKKFMYKNMSLYVLVLLYVLLSSISIVY